MPVVSIKKHRSELMKMMFPDRAVVKRLREKFPRVAESFWTQWTILTILSHRAPKVYAVGLTTLAV